MTPALATALLDLYGRAADAAAAEDVDAAAALIAEAGALLAAPVPPPPDDAAGRAALLSLVRACEESRAACLAAVEAARARLQRAAAGDLRATSAAGHYGDQGAPDARFIDRKG